MTTTIRESIHEYNQAIQNANADPTHPDYEKRIEDAIERHKANIERIQANLKALTDLSNGT